MAPGASAPSGGRKARLGSPEQFEGGCVRQIPPHSGHIAEISQHRPHSHPSFTHRPLAAGGRPHRQSRVRGSRNWA